MREWKAPTASQGKGCIMKTRRLVLALAVACVFALTLGLAGCGGGGGNGGGGSSDAPGTPTTIGKASFNMPDGWVDADESDKYATIQEEADSHHMMKIFCRTLFSSDTIESVAAKEAETHGTAVGEPFELGSYTWIPVDFTFNDTPSRFFFAQIDEGHYTYITAYELTDADEPVKLVLSTLVVTPEE